MANSNDIQEILEMLSVAYPNAPISPKTPDLYESWLGSCDGRILRQAAVDHIQHNKWFPTVAELIERAHLLELNQPTSPGTPSYHLFELEDLAVQGQYDADSWDAFAVELDRTGRTDMAGAVRRRAEYYAPIGCQQ